MTRPETCSKCGEEVRYGWRHDRAGWWHRTDVDHNALFGHVMSGYDIEEIRRRATEAAEPEVDNRTVPLPEVRSTPIEIGDERLPQGAKNFMNWARKAGWEAWATYSRGPRTHAAHGTVLGISDYVLVRFRLDDSPLRAVASWEDRKFDFAYLLTKSENHTYIAERANSDALKDWIKGERHGS